MKVLVTGGAGFIGSHIVRELDARGIDVVVVDYAADAMKHESYATVYTIDVNTDLNEVFEHERPDYVIHHAAQVSVSASMQQPELDGKLNILATINVLKMCVTYGVKQFVFASSAAVYGHPFSPNIHEDEPCKPISFYGLSKLQAEAYIQFFAKQYQLDCTILRYSNVYGPGQSTEGEAGVVALFIHQLERGDTLKVFGDGNQTRDFVYVKDVVAANLRAIEQKAVGIFNIGNGIETSINELIEKLAYLKYKTIEPCHWPMRPGDIVRSSLHSKRAHETFGWVPSYSMDEGLLETIHFYENARPMVNLV